MWVVQSDWTAKAKKILKFSQILLHIVLMHWPCETNIHDECIIVMDEYDG